MTIIWRKEFSVQLLICIIGVTIIDDVASHVCKLQERYNPSSGALQWSLPRKDLCLCQAVVAPRTASVKSCPRLDDTEIVDDLWFTNDPNLLTDRRNWNRGKLDVLLDRSHCNIDECRSNPCRHGAICFDRTNRYICACPRGFKGVNCETDFEEPTIICPSDRTMMTNPSQPTAIVTWNDPKVIDNSGNDTSTACDIESRSPFVIGQTEVICEAVDPFGNHATCNFTVIVLDVEEPTIKCPSHRTMMTDPNQPTAIVTWTDLEANDNSGKDTSTACEIKSRSPFEIGQTEVICEAVDPFGNFAKCNFTVDIVDVEEPTMVCPSDRSMVTDPSQATAFVTWTGPETIDNSGKNTSIACNFESGSNFEIGQTEVICEAVDPFGNRAICKFTVDVADIIKPSIVGIPSNIVQNTDIGLATASVSWQQPTARDNSGVQNLTSSHNPGDLFDIGVTMVIYTSIDLSGNEASETFSVAILDMEKPSIVGIPSNIVQNTDIGLATASVSWQQPTARDNSGVQNLTSSHNPGDLFYIGVTLVIYTSIDLSGNEASETFSVTILDIEKPSIVGIPSKIVQNTDIGLATASVSWPQPTARDNSGAQNLISSHNPGDVFEMGVTMVIYTSIDLSGNEASETFNVTILDNVNPVITNIPADIFINCQNQETGASGIQWTSPTATDNSNSVTLTSSHIPGDSLPSGTNKVLYTAIDGSGNTAAINITVYVADWVVIQRRLDGSLDFYRGWAEYEIGFSNNRGEFWIGLIEIARLTKTGAWRLRVDLKDFYGATRYAEYEPFKISDASDDYRVSVGNYTGTAGEALIYNDGFVFSTKDRNNVDCATKRQGGWWYKTCTWANLNGLYLGSPESSWTGIMWHQWKEIECLKMSEMKLCPADIDTFLSNS